MQKLALGPHCNSWEVRLLKTMSEPHRKIGEGMPLRIVSGSQCEIEDGLEGCSGLYPGLSARMQSERNYAEAISQIMSHYTLITSKRYSSMAYELIN